MAATVHSLFPQASPAAGESQPAPGTAARADGNDALAAELRGRLATQWNELLAHFFAAMPDALTRMADACQNPAEQRRCYDVLRLARLEQTRFTRAFLHESERRLIPEALRPREPQETSRFPQLLEEALTLAEIEVRLENALGPLLGAWQQRADWLARNGSAAVCAEGLTPAGIAAALRAATEKLEIAPEQRRLIYELFDNLLVPRVGEVLSVALKLFDERQVGDPAARGDWATVSAANRTQDVLLDEHSFAMLEKLAATANSRVYDDAALAQDLLRELNVAGSPMLQRAALAGRLLNEFLEDPLLPPVLKPVFEQLRMPIIKSALADASFFTAGGHVVRGLLNELAAMGAAARVAPRRSLKQLIDLARHVLVQFPLRADFVSQVMQKEGALPAAEVARMQAQQEAAANARRDDTVQRARRTAAQEIERQWFGRDLPESTRGFLQHGWAPLMARRLLRQGCESEAWKSAVQRLAQVFDALETRQDAAPAGLLEDLRRELGLEAVPDDRVAAALQSLQQAFATPRSLEARRVLREPTAAPSLSDAANSAALAQILQPSRWFRVYDRDSGASRWLKLVAHYPRVDSLSFAEFDGSRPFRIRASQFLDDLLARRSEAVSPTPEMQAALELLRRSRTTNVA